jgi:hypothetical protein
MLHSRGPENGHSGLVNGSNKVLNDQNLPQPPQVIMSQALPALESKKYWEALPEHERFPSTFGGCRHRVYDSLPSLNIF